MAMHRQGVFHKLGWTLVALSTAFATTVFAAANVQSMRGDVRSGNTQLNTNARVISGSTITTGAGSQAVLKFDDGQTVVLNENTTFRIADFRYKQEEPRGDRSIFDLLRGALRVVSGAVASRSQTAFQLRVPQATIGIRGTDFMVAIVNPAIIAVTTGSVAATNAGGTAVFGAGAFGSVASATVVGAGITAAQVPAAASAAFSSMNAVVGVTAGGLAPGAAGGGAVATTGAATAAGAVAGIAVVGAAAAGNDDSTPATTHHTP
jgi:hypothetical protein